jgi:hypothetical protein
LAVDDALQAILVVYRVKCHSSTFLFKMRCQSVRAYNLSLPRL